MGTHPGEGYHTYLMRGVIDTPSWGPEQVALTTPKGGGQNGGHRPTTPSRRVRQPFRLWFLISMEVVTRHRKTGSVGTAARAQRIDFRLGVPWTDAAQYSGQCREEAVSLCSGSQRIGGMAPTRLVVESAVRPMFPGRFSDLWIEPIHENKVVL